VTTTSSAEPTRRDFLFIATGAAGAVAAIGALLPLVSQMNPDASTIAAGAPIEVDLAPIAEGQVIKVFWRGKPIFINHRSKKEIEDARGVDVASLPDPEPDQKRVKEGHDQWQVLVGICTHLGCIPLAHQGDYNGYFCPCPGSQYDTSGRIRRGPAPTNLALPPYEFLSDTKVRIG
jgi:ubiquinol-cytochrome c reductase iron-sulfur subunit